jgi:hypothetical protein
VRTPHVVRRGYQARMKEVHPDFGRDPATARSVIDAYQRLTA